MFFCDGDFPGSERSVVMFLKDMTVCSVCVPSAAITEVGVG